MEFCLIYLSSSNDLSASDLSALAIKSQENNRSLGITGILLYCNGSIIQVLEGKQEKVNSLYQTILRDPRHKQVTKLYSGQIEKRSFPDWLMGYRTLTENEITGLQEELPFIKNPYLQLGPENIVVSLVRTFYKNNHRN